MTKIAVAKTPTINLPSQTTAEQSLDNLRQSIEHMSDGTVMYSRTAWTARHTPHVLFVNGAHVVEAEEAPPFEGLTSEMCRATLQAVIDYRNTIPGPVSLVWRVEPELRIDDETGRRRVYCRLCFEPMLVGAGDGVWVEAIRTQTWAGSE